MAQKKSGSLVSLTRIVFPRNRAWDNRQTHHNFLICPFQPGLSNKGGEGGEAFFSYELITYIRPELPFIRICKREGSSLGTKDVFAMMESLKGDEVLNASVTV